MKLRIAFACLSLALASSFASARADANLTLEGRVLLPGGDPAEGAVVVSRAGGEAVADAAGVFRLRFALATDVRETQVTAVHARRGGSLVASRRVDLDSSSGTVHVGTLELGTGSGCDPSWLPTFGGAAGTDDRVVALAVFDDGGGPALYVGGGFTSVGGMSVEHVAKWNGSSWAALGSGTNSAVRCFAVWDDGGGPALYVGGNFTVAGGGLAGNIAKWDGSAWSPLGSGLGNKPYALTVYDDGSGAGPQLYAAGEFTTAGGTSANHVARWDGSSWSALGSGTDANVLALAVYDDGSGSALYAGGYFANAGGASANYVARWDGSSWSALGSGMSGGTGTIGVYALAVYDDGSHPGPQLYAGGRFVVAGGVIAVGIARWDGAAWSAVGNGVSGTYPQVLTLAVYDDGTGPGLYAGGGFTFAGTVSANHVARWQNSTWSSVGSGTDDFVYALAAGAGGGGAATLYAGGDFEHAGGSEALHVASWDAASSWSRLGGVGVDAQVRALALYDDGSGAGPALYAGGYITEAGGSSARGVAKWNGSTWSALGLGVQGTVYAMAVYDDGDGPALYVGGEFTSAGGVGGTNRIARWDGSSWSKLGYGMSHTVWSLAVYDDGLGGGPKLFAGGEFTTVDYHYIERIARWDGATWAPVGGGMDWTVNALVVHDDGSGPKLYAGGSFTTSGLTTTNGIAEWNGFGWSALGTGIGGTSSPVVYALASYDDASGSGRALFAGGKFTTMDGVSANRIAKWGGASWSALGSGTTDTVRALAAYDDGSGAGAALFAGGDFTSAGGVATARIARWTGASWSGIGGGTDGPVYALLAHDDGNGAGRALCVAGNFTASPGNDSFVAKWGGCVEALGNAYCFGDGSGTPCPCGNAGGAGEGCANSGGSGAVLAAYGTASVPADDLSFTATQLLPGQPALLFAGQNRVNGGAGVVFGDGLRCAGGGVRRLGVAFPYGAGTAAWGPGLGAAGAWVAGDTRRFQAWYRDPTGSPCGARFNASNGCEITFAP